MKFNVREDIDAPIETVFSMATDFERFERQAMRRGMDVSRNDVYHAPGVGTEWRIRTEYRGKDRRITALLEEYEEPSRLQILSKTGGIEGLILAEFVPLSPRRTRVDFTVDLAAKTLSARLLLQSLKFARGTIMARMKKRMKEFKLTAEAQADGKLA